MELVFQSNSEPFYDRSWQVEVIGPINGGLYGNGPYASLVISNFGIKSRILGDRFPLTA